MENLWDPLVFLNHWQPPVCCIHWLFIHLTLFWNTSIFFLPTDLSTVKTTDNNDNNLKMLKKRLYSENKHIIKQEKSPFPPSRCHLKAAAESSCSHVTTKIKIFPLRPPLCSSPFFILHFQSSLLTCPYVHLNPSYQLHVSHFQH